MTNREKGEELIARAGKGCEIAMGRSGEKLYLS
jgi:hypothetical protein